MTAQPSSPSSSGHLDTDATSAPGSTAPTQVRVLLYSDDSAVRDAVRLAVGRRPARDVEVSEWLECATADAVRTASADGGYDLFVLDGEAAPFGGLGLCRELKHEIYRCPPVVVLTGRPQDGWLAAWSYADEAVPHPIDPLVLAGAVARVARRGAAGETVRPSTEPSSTR